MGNTRLDQEKTTIYTLIKSIVEIIQEVVFDPENEMTGKDYEQVFLYATSLVDYHDYLSGRKLNETIITSCILTLLNDLEFKYAYSQQQLSDLKKNVTDELVYFAEAFDAYLSEKDKEAALMKYVSTILLRFPTAKSTSAFSITGVEFAQIFTHAVTKIAEIYADLTKNTSDNGISLSQESVVTSWLL